MYVQFLPFKSKSFIFFNSTNAFQRKQQRQSRKVQAVTKIIQNNTFIQTIHDFKHSEEDTSPSVIIADITSVWYKNNKIHRDKLPAIIRGNGVKEWWKNGKQHRYERQKNGFYKDILPAVINREGSREWWINGKKLSSLEKEEFKQLWMISISKYSIFILFFALVICISVLTRHFYNSEKEEINLCDSTKGYQEYKDCMFTKINSTFYNVSFPDFSFVVGESKIKNLIYKEKCFIKIKNNKVSIDIKHPSTKIKSIYDKLCGKSLENKYCYRDDLRCAHNNFFIIFPTTTGIMIIIVFGMLLKVDRIYAAQIKKKIKERFDISL